MCTVVQAVRRERRKMEASYYVTSNFSKAAILKPIQKQIHESMEQNKKKPEINPHICWYLIDGKIAVQLGKEESLNSVAKVGKPHVRV